MNNDSDSVAGCVDHILMALNMIADMAQNDPKRREEIAVEEIGLCQIISRAELILDFIDAKRPTRLTIQQPRQHHVL